MNKLLHNEPFYIYGDGKQKRGFSYIKDMLPYLSKCGFVEEAKNQTFNMGGNNVYTVNDLSDVILRVSGKDIKPINLPERDHDVKIAYCDTSKARKILELAEPTSLEEAITNMWKWAEGRGPQEPKYLKYFELPSPKIPKNWIEHK